MDTSLGKAHMFTHSGACTLRVARTQRIEDVLMSAKIGPVLFFFTHLVRVLQGQKRGDTECNKRIEKID